MVRRHSSTEAGLKIVSGSPSGCVAIIAANANIGGRAVTEKPAGRMAGGLADRACRSAGP